MQLTPFTETDLLIAMAIIDSIDESGYLTSTCDAILDALINEVESLELDEIEAVLKRVQHFDPIGIAAKSTQDCLQIQLRHLAKETPWRDEALNVLELHMDLLGNRDYRTLARKTK